MKIDLGNTKGITRELGDSGRLIIPSEFRKELKIDKDCEMEIFLVEEGLFIRKKGDK